MRRQRAFPDEAEAGREEELILQLPGDFLREALEGGVVVGEEVAQLDFDEHLVVVADGLDGNQVVAAQFGELHEDLLHLDGEDVHPFEDNHVVATSLEAGQALVGTTAGAVAGEDGREVAGAVTEQGHGLAVQGGEDHLAGFAIGDRLKGYGIDNLDDDVILPDVEPILRGAFEGDARAVHLRHPKAVICLHAEELFDAFALFLGVRLGADADGVELRIAARVNTHLVHHLRQSRSIAGDNMEASCPKVGDELDLALRIAGSGRDGEGAEAFGSVLEAQSAGEHAVARGVLEHVGVAQSDHVHTASHLVSPFGEVAGGVDDDGRVPCRPARGMQADTLLEGDSHQSEGIVGTEVVFRGERNLAEIVERLDIVGRESVLMEYFLIKRRLDRLPDRPFQAFQLEGGELVAAHRFDVFLPIHHNSTIFNTCLIHVITTQMYGLF